MPLALAIPPTQFIVHDQFNLLYQFWIHTEVRPARIILLTPLISYSYSVLINLVHWNILWTLHHIIEFIMVRWYHYNDVINIGYKTITRFIRMFIISRKPYSNRACSARLLWAFIGLLTHVWPAKMVSKVFII